MLSVNRSCDRGDEYVDDSSSALLNGHRHRYAKEEIQRIRQTRNRRKSCNRTTSESSSNTTKWVRRLLVVSLIAAITASSKSKTIDGFFPVCDAFVAPMSNNNIIIITRPEQRIIPNRRNRKKNKDTAKISAIRNIRTVTTTCLSNSPTSSNDANGTDKNSNNNSKNSAEVAGLILAVGIILSLAGMSGTGGGVGEASDVTSSSVAVMTKVVENTVPTTSTEVVAVTLGESIGGVIGAIFSVAINFVLLGGKKNIDDSSESSESSDKNNSNKSSKTIKKSLLFQGLSDGDYFIANSATFSLLEAVGVPESIAKYSSVFIAAIPSQLVKIGSTISEQKRAKEDQLLSEMFREEMLREEQQRKRNQTLNFLSFPLKKNKNKKNKKVVNPKELMPVAVAAATAGGAAAASITTETTTAVAAAAIDFVEVFADITRWLEYDVLKTEYGETAFSQLWMVENLAAINPLQSAITFALLGSLAAVSSRWYADILYGRFCYGPVEKQLEVRNRNDAEWLSLYLSTAASAAALFGCYEFFQLPIGRYIQGTLAGGFEGCVGSSNFEACMQTYLNINSPGPTAEAQLRALVTNLYAVYIRLQDIAGDTTTDDISVLIRAWSVSIASYIANM